MNLGPINDSVKGAEFDVWLSREMLFNNPPGQNFKRYRKYTKALKLKYTHKICDYLLSMESKEQHYENSMGRACAIKLDGIIRYVWRSDLFTKSEYELDKNERIEAIKALGKKQ